MNKSSDHSGLSVAAEKEGLAGDSGLSDPCDVWFDHGDSGWARGRHGCKLAQASGQFGLAALRAGHRAEKARRCTTGHL